MMMNAFLWICSILLAGSLYGQQPALVVPVGHTDDIQVIDFSPNGQYLLTSSADQTTCVWETASGRLLFNMKDSGVTDAKFSHNGKIILTVTYSNIIKLWDAFSGTLKNVLPLKHFGYNAAYKVHFSKDDRHLFVNSNEGLTVYDVNSLQPIYVLPEYDIMISPSEKIIVSVPAPYQNKVDAKMGMIAKSGGFPGNISLKPVTIGKDIINVSVSANDKYLLAEGLTGLKDYVKVYSVATGKLLYGLEPFNYWERRAAFSPRGTYIVTVHGAVKIWNAANGALLHALSSPGKFRYATMSHDESYIVTLEDSAGLKIWNVSTGKMVRALKNKHQKVIDGYGMEMECSKDDKFILARHRDYGKAVVWEAATGNIIYHSEEDFVNTKMRPRTTFAPVLVRFSSDGRYIALAKFNSGKVWDTKYHHFIHLQAAARVPYKLFSSPDGQYMATLYADSTVTVQEVASGKMKCSIKKKMMVNVALSNDGKIATLSEKDSIPDVWTVADGKWLYSLKGSGMCNSVNFSPDGKKIVTAGNNKISIWDAGTGALIKEIPTAGIPETLAAFSADGSFIITSNGMRWDLLTGERWSRISVDTTVNRSGLSFSPIWNFLPRGNVCVSPDGKFIAATQKHKYRSRYVETIAIVNFSTGETTYLSDSLFRWWSRPFVIDIQFTPDGKQVSALYPDGKMKTWDITTREVKNVSLQQSFSDACFSPQLQYIVTASPDFTTKVFETNSQKLLYSFIGMDSTEYLAIDTAGRYEGTKGARKLLYYVCGNEIIELEQMKGLSWEPGLVAKIRTGAPRNAYSTDPGKTNFCGITPLVEQLAIKDSQYHFRITPRKGGIGEIYLFVGVKHVGTYQPDTLKNVEGSYYVSVDPKALEKHFVGGEENNITIKATTADHQLFSKDQPVNVTEKNDSLKADPHLYCISVGINEYKDSSLALSYASSDAADIERIVTASFGKLLNKEGKEYVTSYIFNSVQTLPERKPLKDNIRKAFETIAGKATASDILLIFLSGHGTLGPNKLFYFPTQQAFSLVLDGVENEVAISSEELREWMHNINAQKQVLILDACHSGQVLQDMKTQKNLGGDQQRALEKLKDMTGTYLLSASASNQAAAEMDEYGRGLLAYGLLWGIKHGEGLINKYLEIDPWFQFAAAKAKEMAKDHSGGQDPQLSVNGSFPIGYVDEALASEIKLDAKKPHFKRSNFQNKELFLDDLNIGQAMDRALYELKFKGVYRPLVFFPDAAGKSDFSIHGRYEIKGEKIAGEARLFRGTQSVMSIEVNATTSTIPELVKQVMDRVLEVLKKIKNE